MNASLRDWLEHDWIRPIDAQLAQQLLRYCEGDSAAMTAAIGPDQEQVLWVLLSQALTRGQVCLRLDDVGPHLLAPEWRQRGELTFASTKEWLAHLPTRTPVWQVQSNQPWRSQPLVLDQDRLYLARYYWYEEGVCRQIQSRLGGVNHVVDGASFRALFSPSEQTDWQAIAAATACLQTFSVITGGPGTGKTTTVIKLLSALLSQQPSLSIALAAPTGKAAARMTESIRLGKHKDAIPYAASIPEQSFTLHRLLGWRPQGFRYHSGHRLPYDCIVVDEASMIDLPMMHHLLHALADDARLILLGDQDQLASVEAGSVLADLCNAGQRHYPSPEFAQRLQSITGYHPHADLVTSPVERGVVPIQDAVAQLRVSYRFAATSGIGELARAVNDGDAMRAQACWTRFDDIDFFSHDSTLERTQDVLLRWQQQVISGYRAYCATVKTQNAEQVLLAFQQFQVLVAVRQGAFGVDSINDQIERLLRHQGLLHGAGLFYPGRAIMITENDYDMGLFNGDVGVVMVTENGLRVAFFRSDGQPDDRVRYVLPSRLPAHETAFAMTVHKSQGSEFERVLLMLPQHWQSVITRELIYTAITRAKQSFTVISSDECWQKGLQKSVERASGLREKLWCVNEYVSG